MNKKIKKLAFRDLKVNKKRNRLTMISILISVFLISMVMNMGVSFYGYMLSEMKISREEVLTIAFGNKVNSLNYKYLTLYTDKDIELVRSAEGVKSATGVKGFGVDSITYDNGKQIITSTLYGIDKSYLDNLGIKISEGKMPQKDEEVLVGNSISKATKLGVGDKIQVTVSGKETDFVISGVIDYQEEQAFNTVPSEINQMIAVNVKSKYVLDSKYGYISAIAKDVNKLSETGENICKKLNTDKNLQNALDGTGISPIVASRKDVKDMLSTWFDYIALFIILLILLIGTIASINIINIFAITIQEKHKDIAVYKIVGASQKQVRLIYVLQSLLLGVEGSVIGTLLGIILSALVITILQWKNNSNVIIYALPFVIGIVTAFLAGYLASRKTDKVDVNVLMNE